MEQNIKKLEDFFEKYAEDYLNDGTKASIIKAIQTGNKKTIMEILSVMDADWVANVKAYGKFRVFTDWHKYPYFQRPPQNYYSISYMNSVLNDDNIPVLRYNKIRQLDFDRT